MSFEDEHGLNEHKPAHTGFKEWMKRKQTQIKGYKKGRDVYKRSALSKALKSKKD